MQTIIQDFLQHRHKYAYFLTDYHSQAPNERPFKPLAITAKPGATPPIKGNRSGSCSIISCLVYRFIIE